MTNKELLAAVYENGKDKGLQEVLSIYYRSLDVSEWATISVEGMPLRDERLCSIAGGWFQKNPPPELERLMRQQRQDDKEYQKKLGTETGSSWLVIPTSEKRKWH